MLVRWENRRLRGPWDSLIRPNLRRREKTSSLLDRKMSNSREWSRWSKLRASSCRRKEFKSCERAKNLQERRPTLFRRISIHFAQAKNNLSNLSNKSTRWQTIRSKMRSKKKSLVKHLVQALQNAQLCANQREHLACNYLVKMKKGKITSWLRKSKLTNN